MSASEKAQERVRTCVILFVLHVHNFSLCSRQLVSFTHWVWLVVGMVLLEYRF